MAIDLESTRAVVAAVERAGAVVQMGFQRRFDAGLPAGAGASCSGAGWGRSTWCGWRGTTRCRRAVSYIPGSGGIFRDLHIHDFDIARFVTGQEITEVYADGGVVAFEVLGNYDDVDTAVAALRFSGGAFGILSGARHDPLGYDIRMEVFGSRDSVAVGVDARTPLRSLEEGVAPPADAYGFFLDRFAPAYREELNVFVEVAAGQRENPCPPVDALEAMRVAVECNVSRREHRPVRVEEVG